MIPFPKIIDRYSPPSLLDQCPKGTVLRVKNNAGDIIESYEQIADDSEKPVWTIIAS